MRPTARTKAIDKLCKEKGYVVFDYDLDIIIDENGNLMSSNEFDKIVAEELIKQKGLF